MGFETGSNIVLVGFGRAQQLVGFVNSLSMHRISAVMQHKSGYNGTMVGVRHDALGHMEY